MRKVEIGTEKYTTKWACGEKSNGANHTYIIERSQPEGSERPEVPFVQINFQNGPIKEVGEVNGVMNEDLIAIVIDRLQGFQESEFKCRENAIAITKLEESLLWLRKRTMDRERRGVLGTHAA